ncbi:hypothetical protein R2A130_1898 [Ahrensia sp. R2A130]|nr:hypothetical protein R2A130_1898 [Ahrensia sp. R2A130]
MNVHGGLPGRNDRIVWTAQARSPRTVRLKDEGTLETFSQG